MGTPSRAAPMYQDDNQLNLSDTMRLQRDSTALLVVDIQSRLAPAMHQSESAIQANSALIRAARQLDIPVFASEHCAEKIGPTVADLRTLLKDDEILHKRHFSSR